MLLPNIPRLRSAALHPSFWVYCTGIITRALSPKDTSRREWLFLNMWRCRTCQFMPLYECFGMMACSALECFCSFLLEQMCIPATPWAMCLRHLGLRGTALWLFSVCVLCHMKCTISCVPKLVTVTQVVKYGISFNPQWHHCARILSCCNIRNAFPSNMSLGFFFNHIPAFLREPICPQIVKLEDAINHHICSGNITTWTWTVENDKIKVCGSSLERFELSFFLEVMSELMSEKRDRH